MNKFLERFNLPKLNEEEGESPNRPITHNEIETVIKKLPTHKIPAPDGFTGEFYSAFRKNAAEQGRPHSHPPRIISKNSRRWKTSKLLL